MINPVMPKVRHTAHLPRYDLASMLSSSVGRHGYPEEELSALYSHLDGVRSELSRQRKAGEVGFFSIPERNADVVASIALAKAVAKKFRTLIVIGIGGSDLGARTLIDALTPRGTKKGMEVRFIGANTDPEEIAGLLRDVDLKKCALNIVSKSGGTIEPMAAFLLLRDRLIKAVGKKAHAAHVIATTDPKKGVMREIAEREGYRTLPVPDDIGGRFSALTPVGLFPAACAGIDVKGLVEGAKAVRDAFFSDAARENAPLLFAGLQCDAYLRRQQRITVLMPYSSSLASFGKWFQQLWAESLGKRMSRAGARVHHGFTPVAAIGATDQHSQIQLYQEGPFDKTVTFIEVAEFREAFKIPAAFDDLEGVAYLKGLDFARIIHAERAATAHALASEERPNGTITVADISPRSIGALMMFFMLATAAAGELLDVDPYDQPGVESGKRAMYAMLGRKGFSL